MKTLYEREGSHLLRSDGARLILEVLVGTSATYAVRLTLNEAETQAYAGRGTVFIDELAARICRDEPRFREQGRTAPVCEAFNALTGQGTACARLNQHEDASGRW